MNWHSKLDPNQDFVVNCVGASSTSVEGYVQSYVEGQDSTMTWLEQGKVGSLFLPAAVQFIPKHRKDLWMKLHPVQGCPKRVDYFGRRTEMFSPSLQYPEALF